MRYAALLLGLWLGLAINGHADQTFEKVRGAKFTGYLVPKAIADGWMRTYNDPKWLDDGQCWVPTSAQAIEAEKAVRDYITRAQKDAKVAFPNDTGSVSEWRQKSLVEVGQKYPQYVIQFVGIMVNGKKQIFCNYSCRDTSQQLDPSRNFIFVYDGGSCFWQIEYVPGTKSCTGLQINGNA